MASLSLPAPRRAAPSSSSGIRTKNATGSSAIPSTVSASSTSHAPSYEDRCRAASEASRMTPEQRKKLFLPRSLADFDDGGAFPEIHVAQYPRHMGNPHLTAARTATSTSIANVVRGAQQTNTALISVEIDKDGDVSYDALVKSGTNANRIVYTKLEDMRGGGPSSLDDIALPTQEEEQATTERTALALQALLASHTALSNPSGSAMVNAETSKNMEAKTQFIKYTPRPDAPGYNPAAAQRVIQMVPAQVDPMVRLVFYVFFLMRSTHASSICVVLTNIYLVTLLDATQTQAYQGTRWSCRRSSSSLACTTEKTKQRRTRRMGCSSLYLQLEKFPWIYHST